jgi:hypothetical protein
MMHSSLKTGAFSHQDSIGFMSAFPKLLRNRS